MKKLLLVSFVTLLGGSVQAATPLKHAIAYCPMTHVTGHGHAPTLDAAEDKAIKDCIDKGGVDSCCHKFVNEVKA
jgi:hypothetical protein